MLTEELRGRGIHDFTYYFGTGVFVVTAAAAPDGTPTAMVHVAARGLLAAATCLAELARGAPEAALLSEPYALHARLLLRGAVLCDMHMWAAFSRWADWGMGPSLLSDRDASGTPAARGRGHRRARRFPVSAPPPNSPAHAAARPPPAPPSKLAGTRKKILARGTTATAAQ